MVAFIANRPFVAAQQGAATRVAEVPSEKGGQDIFGAYEVVPGWPKKLSTIPGHGPWTFGAGQSVFAPESRAEVRGSVEGAAAW